MEVSPTDFSRLVWIFTRNEPDEKLMALLADWVKRGGMSWVLIPVQLEDSAVWQSPVAMAGP
jgi:hypothetical protein